MTITVDIRPEVRAELASWAAVHGRAVEAYVASLLEAAVHLPTGAGKLSQDRLENTLREMTQFSHKDPGAYRRGLHARASVSGSRLIPDAYLAHALWTAQKPHMP